MKKTFFLFVLLGLFFLENLSAQNAASAKWNLSTLDSMKVSSTVGTVIGQNETIGVGPNGMVIANYNANGQRLNQGSFGWAQETTQNDLRFIQFNVSPSTGYDLSITNVSFNYGWAGSTTAMKSNVYYSLDNWVTRTQLNSDVGTLVYGNSTGTAYTKTLNVPVASEKTFSLRIYPFWTSSTTTSTTKYAVHNTVEISGITTVSGSSTPLTVNTNAITNITFNSAVSGGNIISDGGSTVTARGVCWNKIGSPTVADNKTVDGSGIGIFSSSITGLTATTKYYVRAYATNSDGTNYGTEVTFTTLDPPMPAFPGAEGFGKYTIGGRCGTVYEVTNLNDDTNPGSLRYAVNQTGPRTIVFRVSGTITLNSDLNISIPYITIAGQTAPGDGICLKKYSLNINTYQAIVRFIRVRLGDETGGESDAMGGRFQHNIIIDHCSISWSEDETLSPYWNDSLTVQWSIISESLYNSSHPKGAHGYGGIWGGNFSTYHHNLLAHHSSRNPRFASGCGVNDFRNNVIYNWGFNSTYGGEARDTSYTGTLMSKINMVANYYKPGPATRSGVVYRIVNPSTRNGLADYGSWYITNNYVYGYPNATSDNWTYGVQGPTASDKLSIKSNEAFTNLSITQQTAETAYESVLKYAGALLPKRDPVDTRVVNEVRNGNATFGGATYSTDSGKNPTGIIDSQTDVGGWPTLSSTTAPVDTDHDGIPDTWETQHGLNPNSVTDGNLKNSEGYTNLELYLNNLVDVGIASSVDDKEVIPTGFKLYDNYPNPFNPSAILSYQLPVAGLVTLKIYDVLGREVATLVNEFQNAGTYHFQFSVHSYQLSSGIYFYTLKAENYFAVKKMILMK
jgi:hypothetical protein